MSQFALGLASALGLWTIGMGASAVTGGFGGSKTRVLPSSSKVIKLPPASEIAKQHKEFKCITDLFGDVDLNVQPNNETLPNFTNKGNEGCLTIWWEKEIYDGGNWRGAWNALWAMKSENRGMIYISSVKNGDTKAIINSSLYSLKKSQQSNKWEVGVITSLNSDGFIMPNNEFINAANGWDFYSNWEKRCSSTNKCESASPKYQSSNTNWKFVNGSNPIYEWIKDIKSLVLGEIIKNQLSQVKGYFELQKAPE